MLMLTCELNALTVKAAIGVTEPEAHRLADLQAPGARKLEGEIAAGCPEAFEQGLQSRICQAQAIALLIRIFVKGVPVAAAVSHASHAAAKLASQPVCRST